MQIDLLPLGTGKGATAVYDGDPSSSFVIRRNGTPVLLVDVGNGAVRRCLELAGSLPRTVYVSHNHTDHAGELPVIVIVERTAGRPLNIVAAPEVAERLRSHRLDELYSTGKTADELARWLLAPEGEAVDLGDKLSLATVRSRHTEISYGFVLYYAGNPILGWSSDSGRDDGLYESITAAPMVVVDARMASSAEHASFAEIEDLARRHPNTDVWVTGYGRPAEAPGGLKPLRVGEPVVLFKGD